MRIGALELLNDHVQFIKGVLDFVISIVWRQFQLEHQSINFIDDNHYSFILFHRHLYQLGQVSGDALYHIYDEQDVVYQGQS
jgi:hypothetical protein